MRTIKVIKKRDVEARLRRQQTIAVPKAPRRSAMQAAADFLFSGRDVKRLRVDRENAWFNDLAAIVNPSGGFNLSEVQQ